MRCASVLGVVVVVTATHVFFFCPCSADALAASLYEADSLWQAFTDSVGRNGDLACFGARTADGFSWHTYKQVQDRAERLGSAVRRLGVKPGQAIGIYARNREEWMTTELAMCSQSIVTVAIYDTLGADSISYCINHADIEVLFCDGPKVSNQLLLFMCC